MPGDRLSFLVIEIKKKRLFGKLHSCLSIQTQSNPSRPSVLHSLYGLPVAVFLGDPR